MSDPVDRNPSDQVGTAPDPVALRRRTVAVAGHRGDTETALDALGDDDAGVRVAALGAAERLGVLDADHLARAFTDGEIAVRRRAAELAAAHPEVDLRPLLDDDEPSVVEVAAWACGEHEHADPDIIERLIALAAADDPLVRESSVAALGAIGDPQAVPTIIAAATSDKPAVRRRAVLALAPFDGPDVDDAIRQALDDRDWQVRQSAEELAPRDD